jgi:hypothetical protein
VTYLAPSLSDAFNLLKSEKMSHPLPNIYPLRGLSKQGEQMSKFRSIFPRQFFVPRDRETSDPVARYQAVKQVQQAKGKTYGGRNVESR